MALEPNRTGSDSQRYGHAVKLNVVDNSRFLLLSDKLYNGKRVSAMFNIWLREKWFAFKYAESLKGTSAAVATIIEENRKLSLAMQVDIKPSSERHPEPLTPPPVLKVVPIETPLPKVAAHPVVEQRAVPRSKPRFGDKGDK